MLKSLIDARLDMTTSYPWCAEIELLLACARKDMTAPDVARAAAAVASGVSWPRVIDYARAHGLVALLARHADALGAPPDARAAIQARALGMARRRLRLTRELLGILRECDQAGILAVPLKGPVLAHRVYGDVTLRYYGDLDILFRATDLPAVSALMTARGYRVESIPDASRFTSYNAHDFAAYSGGTCVELHYALTTPRGRAPQGLETLEGALERREFLGTTVRVLPAAVELEYLYDHGAAHAWGRIEWLATADALDTRGHGEVPARRRAARALADRLLRGGRAPADLEARFARANADVVARLSREPGRAVPTPREAFRYQRLTEPGVAARLHLAAMTLLYPTRYDLEELPGWMAASPLRFVSRPIGLAARWWRGSRPQAR